jgi:UDP-N-acetylmuramate: L-alanyl-gamma-D-glutamyl-meso-diaminopimelate ligase
MVGSQIEGFDTMVKLSNDAEYIILEGDEYLSSPIDLRSKFLWYKPHIALLTGIAWDHINVFPTWEGYVEQFSNFADTIADGGYLTFFEGDEELVKIANQQKDRIEVQAYRTHENRLSEGKTFLNVDGVEREISVFGEHNLQNISGAKNICNQTGITDTEFYDAIANFKGAAKRLQTLKEKEGSVMYLDFAHSPSKLKATTKAVKQQFPNRTLVACMELHTFSSLKADFLPQYNKAMNEADIAYVYFSPKTVEHKKLDPITKEDVYNAFGYDKLKVFTSSEEITAALKAIDYANTNLLLMTSGNFGGVDLKSFVEELD